MSKEPASLPILDPKRDQHQEQAEAIRAGLARLQGLREYGRLLLRVGEACAMCGIGRDQGYRLVQSGQWPSIRVGRSVRVPLAGLLAWLEGLQQEAGDER